MAVRIQPAIDRTAAVSFQAANVASVLFLAPAAMIALVFSLWRLGEDLGWTGPFVISEGLFSHWLVWMMLAIGLKALAVMVTRDHANRNTQKENSTEMRAEEI